MANLSGTQKKKQNQFIALVIAIIVVVAAIAFVVVGKYAFITFSNDTFESVLASALDAKADFISDSDLKDVKYFEFYNDGTNLSVYLGDDDFLTKLAAYEDEQEAIADAEEAKQAEIEEAKKAAEDAGEEFNEEEFVATTVVPEETVKHPAEETKNAVGTSTKAYEKLNDIKYFTSVKRMSVIGAEIDSASFKSLKNLTNATFDSCKFDSLDGFKALDLAKFESITFSNCTGISDWTPLESIADKVTVINYFPIDLGDGNVQYYPMSYTLAEMLAESEAEETTETTDEATEDGAEETTEETAEEVTEENTEENTEEATEVVTEENTEEPEDTAAEQTNE